MSPVPRTGSWAAGWTRPWGKSSSAWTPSSWKEPGRRSWQMSCSPSRRRAPGLPQAGERGGGSSRPGPGLPPASHTCRSGVWPPRAPHKLYKGAIGSFSPMRLRGLKEFEWQGWGLPLRPWREPAPWSGALTAWVRIPPPTFSSCGPLSSWLDPLCLRSRFLQLLLQTATNRVA